MKLATNIRRVMSRGTASTIVLALMLAALLAGAAPAFAQQGPITATGVLERAAPHGEDPEPIYAITDEVTGTSYELISGFVNLESYVGQRVTIQGTPVPGPGDPSRPPLLNVTQVEPVDGPSPSDEATLSFELTVEGDPPADATFFGFIPAEGGMSVRLTDPDSDGLYTGSMIVDKYGPGPRPVPPGTEPVSLPVQIVQGTGTIGSDGTHPGEPIRVIKDFGSVKMDGDKTFSASVSFGTTPGEETTGGAAEPTGDNGEMSGANRGSSSGTVQGDERAQEGIPGAVGDAFGNLSRGGLPDTGGGWAVLLLVGAALIGGGWLLVRRFSSSR